MTELVGPLHFVCNIYKVLHSCSFKYFSFKIQQRPQRKNKNRSSLHHLGIPTSIPDNSNEDDINSDQGLL